MHLDKKDVQSHYHLEPRTVCPDRDERNQHVWTSSSKVPFMSSHSFPDKTSPRGHVDKRSQALLSTSSTRKQ